MPNGMPTVAIDPVTDQPATPGNIFSRMATADTNAVQVGAAGRRRLLGYSIANNTASAKYVRFYNKATAPNPAADAALVVLRVLVPANGIAAFHIANGLDGFAQGLGIAATGAAGDSDATALAANDLLINVFFL